MPCGSRLSMLWNSALWGCRRLEGAGGGMRHTLEIATWPVLQPQKQEKPEHALGLQVKSKSPRVCPLDFLEYSNSPITAVTLLSFWSFIFIHTIVLLFYCFPFDIHLIAEFYRRFSFEALTLINIQCIACVFNFTDHLINHFWLLIWLFRVIFRICEVTSQPPVDGMSQTDAR